MKVRTFRLTHRVIPENSRMWSKRAASFSGTSRLSPPRTPDSRTNSENLVVCKVKPAIHSLSKAEQSYKILGESSLAFPTLHSSWEMSARQCSMYPSVMWDQSSINRGTILGFNISTGLKRLLLSTGYCWNNLLTTQWAPELSSFW